MKRPLVVLAVAAASVLVLAGCSNSPADDGKLNVVASTNVYGQIALVVGGDDIDVTSIIAKASQDPHSFEPSARDQLTVGRADLILQNGGGYDPFMEQLVQASGTKAPVITAVTYAPGWPTDAAPQSPPEGFNEHVWYDPATMAKVANELAVKLGTLDPDHAASFTANAAGFSKGIDGLNASLTTLKERADGSSVFVTEPVPLYLTAAAGLENVTPEAFSEAVEEGQDVPPATLLEALNLIRGGEVDVVIANAQTGGAETTQVIAAAKEKSIPVLEFLETLPEGKTYLEWMSANIDALSAALT